MNQEPAKHTLNPPARRSSASRRTAKISLSLTPNEKRRIIDAAEATDRIISDFLREEIMLVVAQIEKQRPAHE